MNRFGSNNFEDENEQFSENQRVNRMMGENSPRPWDGGNNPYRAPQNRRHPHPHYRPDTPSGHYGEGRHRMSGERPQMPGAPYDDPRRHHDDRIWSERNDYKDHDYRYRSGHRGYWHEDYDETYENRHHQKHPENFFVHLGQGIRDGWNNLFHRHPEEHREMEDRRLRDDRRRNESPNYVPNPHWPYNQNPPRNPNSPQNPNYVPNPHWPYDQHASQNPNYVPNPHWPYDQNRGGAPGPYPRQNPQNPGNRNPGPDPRDQERYDRDSFGL